MKKRFLVSKTTLKKVTHHPTKTKLFLGCETPTKTGKRLEKLGQFLGLIEKVGILSNLSLLNSIQLSRYRHGLTKALMIVIMHESQ